MGTLLAFPALVWSQTNFLQGEEIALGGALRGDQTFPAVAVGNAGGFIVWQDNITDPSGLGISARRLTSGLAPAGAAIPVNQTLGNDQSRPKVDMLNDGGAVVVWQSGRPGAQNVYARFLTAAGGVIGGEVVVNNTEVNLINRYTTNWTLIRNNRLRNQRYKIREVIQSRQEFNANPDVAALTDGTVAIAYASSRVYTTNTFTLNETLRWDNKRAIFITNRTRVPSNVRVEAMQDVYLQRISAAGQKLGGEFRANQFTSFNQRDPAIASLDNGNFVATWVSEQQRFDNSMDIYARVFDVLGNPLGDEFLVNTANPVCSSPSATAVGGGGFTIAWTQRAAERANGLDIMVRTFNANGEAVGPALGANTFTYGDQFAPSISSLSGQQVVVWSSMGQDGSWHGVFGRALNGGGFLGAEFRVNVSTPFSQMHPRIAADGASRALIIWSGYTTSSGFDLFGRTYATP